ncbi:hypothetical protein BQ8794_50290 [Mesorhizobium prunaredense]|uniref:Uncharacterized protein n=1 Tax=Mesorhizobium prunaredense TaxID=1631249 RepID=A0A1R3VE70_9HYPH|nr:hypothetical protein BQ8794_50290 [Mesorhizobium prunaredense]
MTDWRSGPCWFSLHRPKVCRARALCKAAVLKNHRLWRCRICRQTGLANDRSGGSLKSVHQPGIGGGDTGDRVGASRRGFDLERTTAGRQGKEQELAVAAIADASRGDVLAFAFVLNAHLEQQRAADRLKRAADKIDEFVLGNGVGVRRQIGQAFGKRIFESFVVELRVHANLIHSPITPLPLIKVNVDNGRIMAVFPAFSNNALLPPGHGWTIRLFVPQCSENQWGNENPWEEKNARTDAGMAAALPQAHRQRSQAAR